MTGSGARVQFAPGYVLHQRPYLDTGRILEVFTRDHGRLTVFAQGARGPKSRLAPLLQPFQLLLLSFVIGRGEAATLTGAEAQAYEAPIPGASLMGAFYISELLIKLTPRLDPEPEVFEAYREALSNLRNGALEPALRAFEMRLLAAIGYGLELTAVASGAPVSPVGHYHFTPGQGLVPVAAAAPGAFPGRSLLCLAQGELHEPGVLEDARRLLRTALAECLGGRALKTRAVAASVHRKTRRTD